jgi:hypothetical protein
MPSINNLLTKWKLWINRDRTFQADELKELQSHLMEEINYLVSRVGLSEEEAFHKAVSLVGEREGLDQEYVKVKSAPSKVMHWVKIHPWSLLSSALMIVFTLGYFLGWYPVQKEIKNLYNQLYSINTNKKSYKPFVLTENSIEPINKPQVGWETKFKTVELNENTVLAGKGLANPPVFDEQGNMYFVDLDRCLYSLDSSGMLRWKKIVDKNSFYKEKIVVVKDGILVISQNGLEFLDKKGETIWVKDGSMLEGPFIRNDGLVVLVQDRIASFKNNYDESKTDVIAIDATCIPDFNVTRLVV